MFQDTDIKLDYSDVLIVPRENNLSSRSEINLNIDHFDLPVHPVIAANMDGVGTFAMAKVLSKYKIMTSLIKHYSVDALLDFYRNEEEAAQYCFYTMGIGERDVDQLDAFSTVFYGDIDNCALNICIDVANGYSTHLDRLVETIRKEFPDVPLMVGNVATPERTERLIELGADIVKVGIGPGSVCTTRKMTGVGYPQFSAVLECAEAADSVGGTICADGGVTCVGDVAKAIGAGAKYVMCGGLLAGHDEGMDENDDPYRLHPAAPTVPFYGMASKEAQEKHRGGVADYAISEGKYVEVPARGSVVKTVREINGGLRSACTYVGAANINELGRKAKFVHVNRQLNTLFGA